MRGACAPAASAYAASSPGETMTHNSLTPVWRISSMMIWSAVLVTPSRSTRLCKGRVRWVLPAAVMTAFLISTENVLFENAEKLTDRHPFVNPASGWQPMRDCFPILIPTCLQTTHLAVARVNAFAFNGPVISQDATIRGTAMQQGPGGRMVSGQLIVNGDRLRFDGGGVAVEMTLNGLQLRAGGHNDEQLFFEDAARPDWILTTSNHAILGWLAPVADPA